VADVAASRQHELSQCWGWRHSALDGGTGTGGDGGHAPRKPSSRHRPGWALSCGRTPFEGVTIPFRGVWHGGMMGVCGTVPQSDIGHPAQHPHNAGDGCTVAGCSNSAGIGFPGCVRRSAWRGFAFDLGACGASEHLMPRSGEQVGRRGPREASSEAETHPRGRDPRARRELSRGAKALDRGRVTLEGRHALERGREFRGAVPAPRARRRFTRRVPGTAVWWATKAFWVVGFICFWAAAGAGFD
jgi:hypothetical protein